MCIHWSDIACKQRLLYPPELLETLFYPHLAAQIELLHGRGIKVLFHSDGDVSKALPRLVECGIDAFNPLEITAEMDVPTFQEICGPDVVLAGGLDAVDVLALGSPASVAAETIRLMAAFRRHGNLIVGSASGEIDNSMPTENVLAMMDTVWKHGWY